MIMKKLIKQVDISKQASFQKKRRGLIKKLNRKINIQPKKSLGALSKPFKLKPKLNFLPNNSRHLDVYMEQDLSKKFRRTYKRKTGLPTIKEITKSNESSTSQLGKRSTHKTKLKFYHLDKLHYKNYKYKNYSKFYNCERSPGLYPEKTPVYMIGKA